MHSKVLVGEGRVGNHLYYITVYFIDDVGRGPGRRNDKADVSAVIGSPTARDAFDDNTWLYISELTRERIGRTLGELNQNVVVINFDDKGVLTNVHQLDKADALPVTVIARTTPSPGTEASFMQQLLGNIGRFNPAGIVPSGGTGATGGGLGGSPAR